MEGGIIDFSEGLPPDTPEFEMIVHRSQIMAEAVVLAKRSALFDVPLLITEESGNRERAFCQGSIVGIGKVPGPFYSCKLWSNPGNSCRVRTVRTC